MKMDLWTKVFEASLQHWSRCFKGHLDHPYKCFVASRHNLCIDGYPRHPAPSRVILIIHIIVLVHQGTTCASIDIQDIELHQGSCWVSLDIKWVMSGCSLMHWWTYILDAAGCLVSLLIALDVAGCLLTTKLIFAWFTSTRDACDNPIMVKHVLA